VANPAWRLTWALAALKTPSEEIGAAGVYEPVREPRPEELAALALTVPDLERTVTHGGGQALLGLRGESLPLVRAFSPSLSITGWGVEATRPGFLPAAAWAELTATLVPRQTPAELLAGIEAALRARDLADVTVELVAGYPGAETPADAPLVALARRLVEEHLGSPVLLPFAAHPAPLARLAGAPAAIGLGPGRAPWPILEERVVALARLLAALLHHL
jgi:acetylornithine deacetylase/succinyl-diaminopimelate desuccinylase-like protein